MKKIYAVMRCFDCDGHEIQSEASLCVFSFLLRRLSPFVLSLGLDGLPCEEVTFPDEGTL